MADFTYDEVMTALRNADASGDMEDAARLAEIANSMTAKVGSSDTADKPSYLAEAARKGLTRFPSQVYGAFKGALTGTGQTGAQQAVKESQAAMTGMLGGTGALPQTQAQQILAAGVESASDPLSYILPGGAFATQAGMMMKPVAKAAEAFFAGGGAEAGGIAGGKAGGMLGGETGEKFGRGAGSLIGGVTGNTVAGTIPRVVSVASPVAGKVSSLIAKARGQEPVEAAERAAQSHIDNIFTAAAQADPNFVNVFESALKAQERTGIKMPLSSMMKDNAVINAYIGHLASRYPQFRESFAEQFDAVKDALGSKSTSLFGKASTADEFLAKSFEGSQQLMKQQAKAVGRKTGEMTRQAQEVAEDVTQVNPAEFGSRITKTVENAEEAARASTRPLYDNALKVIAKERGVELPESAVDDIFQTVVGGKNSDIFASFPSIYRKVQSRFAPKVEQPSGLVDELGQPFGKPTEKFAAASVEDLDSLKREINMQLRGARTDSHIRVLQDLKSKVNQHIEQLDPVFVDAYKKADQTFLAKVGLPFNEETIKSIERAKFDENVVPLLTRNKSTVDQFISTTGESGKKLVEDAFVSEMSKFVKDGVIDTAKAKGWLASKREALSLVPDVRDRLNKIVGSTDQLMARKSQIDSAFDAATKSRILGKEGMSAQALVGKMYSSPQYTGQFMKQYGNDKDAVRAVRSFMLDDIINSKNPLETLGDRTRSNVYDAVFGKTYKQVVNDLATISDRITKDPSAVAASLKDMDADMLTQMVGMKPERLTSLFFTNPVVSKPVAVMTVLNRFVNKKAGDIAEKKMMEMLLDKEAGTKMLMAIKQSMQKGDSQDLSKFALWAKGRGYDFVDMLKQDAKAGAMRAYGGMQEGELDTSYMEQ